MGPPTAHRAPEPTSGNFSEFRYGYEMNAGCAGGNSVMSGIVDGMIYRFCRILWPVTQNHADNYTLGMRHFRQ